MARSQVAVPFGGQYRIIDFTLSNCLNSGIRKMLVLTQYKAMSLDRHINLGWRRHFCRELDEFIDVVPPQQEFTIHFRVPERPGRYHPHQHAGRRSRRRQAP